jgi:RNA polymerase sigma factor (sigma-70 family)
MQILLKEDDLDRLIERCRRSDSEAWAALVDRFQALVYSVPRRYGLGPDDAADVFQTTFQSLLRSLDRIESAKALAKWLAVTAARESMRLRRIAGRTTNPEDYDMALDEVVASEEASAEETAVASEEALMVREAVAKMPAKCRDLLQILYLEGDVPYTEVSERLGMPVGAIGPTRARCLEKLRGSLLKNGFFE